MSSSSSLKLFVSVAILTFVGGYGLSKLYYNDNNNKLHTQEHEITDDTEKVIIKKSLFSSPVYTNKSIIISNHNNNINNNRPSPTSKKHFYIIENLIMSITTKQNQAIYFRKRYHKNLNEILKQIDDMREKICFTEEEHLKEIHNLLDEIENYNKHKDINLPENKSHVKELEEMVTREEAYLDTELKVLQADLGMLMWKYEELENYDLREWKNSQLEIQRLREKLMEDATRFSKMKSKNYYYYSH